MIALMGPTSSGKTSLALKLAKKFNFDIVSFDSRQVYKYLDVGTGKLPINTKDIKIEKNDNFWVMNGVKVWMYDVVTPDKDYSVARYISDLKSVVLPNLKKKVIYVGGTGYFLQSLINPQETLNIPPDYHLRQKLKDKRISELQSMLALSVLESMNTSDRNNRYRLIRKIEISRVKNSRFKIQDSNTADAKNLIIGLTAPREILYQRVDQWVDTIWGDLMKEIEKIDKLGFLDSNVLNGIVYKHAKEIYNRKTDSSHALRMTKYDLHAYIRRQMTYFKKMNGIKWFDITDPNFELDITGQIKYHLGKHGN